MILIYAFSNSWGTNISRRVLLDLQKKSPFFKGRSGIAERDFKLIHGYPHQFFQKYIQNSHYDLIIGLGNGSKKILKVFDKQKTVYTIYKLRRKHD